MNFSSINFLRNIRLFILDIHYVGEEMAGHNAPIWGSWSENAKVSDTRREKEVGASH